MKTICIVLALLFTLPAFSQKPKKNKKWTTTVITAKPGETTTIQVDMSNIDTTYVYEDDMVKEQPLFPGSKGMDTYDKTEEFVKKHLKQPEEMKNCECDIFIPASINFDRKGLITDIQLGSSDTGCNKTGCDAAKKACEKEALRVLNLLPKQWTYKPRGRGKEYSLAWSVDFKH